MAKRKKSKSARAVYKFDGGKEHALSLVELHFQTLAEAARAYASDDLSLRMLGERRLREAAEACAEVAIRRKNNRDNLVEYGDSSEAFAIEEIIKARTRGAKEKDIPKEVAPKVGLGIRRVQQIRKKMDAEEKDKTK